MPEPPFIGLSRRGSPVVEAILGNIFSGVLVTDAWCAYHKITCPKAKPVWRIYSQIRKFYEAYPHLRSPGKIQKEIGRIIQDGVKLQALKSDLSVVVLSGASAY